MLSKRNSRTFKHLDQKGATFQTFQGLNDEFQVLSSTSRTCMNSVIKSGKQQALIYLKMHYNTTINITIAQVMCRRQYNLRVAQSGQQVSEKIIRLLIIITTINYILVCLTLLEFVICLVRLFLKSNTIKKLKK